jgi:hypothetical protein
MIVDIVTEDDTFVFRYTTTRVPMIGETIATLRPAARVFEVVGVDHLVRPTRFAGEYQHELTTVTVRENWRPKSGRTVGAAVGPRPALKC